MTPRPGPARRPAPLPAAALLVALVVAGCAGADPTRYYTLGVTPPTTVPVAVAVPGRLGVGVGPVTLPDYLDRPQIVTRRSAFAIDYAAADQWAGSLRDILPRVLTENLRARLPADRVVGFPQPGAGGIDYRVAVDITRFDVDTAGEARLVAGWRIYDRAQQRLVLQGDEVVTRTADGPGAEAAVAALSASLADLSDRLADSLARVLTTAPRPTASR